MRLCRTNASGNVGASLLLVISIACCSSGLHLVTFKHLRLDEQVTAYKAAVRKGCPIEAREGFLYAMARHGDLSVTAMEEILRHPDRSFPIRDAVQVLRFAGVQGADLSSPEVIAALRTAAKGAVRLDDREKAEELIREIEEKKAAGH